MSLKNLPSYDEPLVTSPHLDQTILDSCCMLSHNLQVIHSANLTSMNQLWSENYKQDRIDKLKHVVLQFDGSVSGVQYDRVGAVWVNGIELLRTTTPEPSTIEGDLTSWRIERDVTDFINVLTGNGENVASISIPNTVDKEYTGVLHVNVSLAFYVAKDGEEKEGYPVAINLESDVIDQTRGSNETSVWSTISFTTNSIKNFTIEKKDLVHRLSSFASLGTVYMDVHASAHSSEEFYYTKPVNTTCIVTNETGCISGGPLRFLRVRIDGQLAGAATPFPTVYTGGINPLLWRPLTGINSFDVQPIRFDLTPFAGVFDRVLRANNPERETTIQLEVATGEKGHVVSAHDGVWFVDGSLLFVPSPSNERARVPSPARFDSVRTDTVSPLSVAVDQILTQKGPFDFVHMSPYIFSVIASSSTSGDSMVVTYNVNSTGLLRRNEVEGSIGSSTETKDSDRDFAFGYMRQEVVTMTHVGDSWLRRNSTTFYSYKSDTCNGADEATFDLNANVTWSRSRFEEYASSEEEDIKLDVFWGNSIQAAARYNRSLSNHTDVNIAKGHSHETFAIAVPPNDDICYDAKLTAVNGSLVGEGNVKFEYDCQFSYPLYFCGAELCGLAEYKSLFWKNIARREETFHGKSTRSRRRWLGSFFFFAILFGCIYALYIKRYIIKDTFDEICTYIGINELMRRRQGGGMQEPLMEAPVVSHTMT